MTDVNGTVIAEYDYDAYGLPVGTLPPAGSIGDFNPYRYAGYRYDSETGFYYLNAWYYWANVGRFITRDSFHGFEDDEAKNYSIKIDPLKSNGTFKIRVFRKDQGEPVGVLTANKVFQRANTKINPG